MHYQIKGYRLNKETIKRLANLKKNYKSYNLMFADLINIKNMQELKTNKTGKVEWQGIKTGDKCPYCHGQILIKTGKFGEFYACSEFPYCGFTQKK